MWDFSLTEWGKAHPHLFTFLKVAVILTATLFLRFVLVWLMMRALRKTTELEAPQLTRLRFLRHLLSLIVIVLGVGASLYTIPSMQNVGTSLLAGAGVLAAIIGFASQAAFGNLISGIFIVIYKPFRVNDLINVQDHMGIVEDVTLNHTVIRNFENRRIVIPNSMISGSTLVNSTIVDERICLLYDISVSVDNDLGQALAIMAEAAAAHPLALDIRTEEEKEQAKATVQVMVLALTDYAAVLRVSVWAASGASAFALRTDLNRTVHDRFRAAGIRFADDFFRRAFNN